MANILLVGGQVIAGDPTKLALNVIDLVSSDLCQTAVSTTTTPAAVTLPAAGAGLFHYITLINAHHCATTAAVVGTAVAQVTATNLPGTPIWNCGNAAPIGVLVQDVFLSPTCPIKSSVANTATVITHATMLAGVTSRLIVHYYVGA
jgi:hypothetical protein